MISSELNHETELGNNALEIFQIIALQDKLSVTPVSLENSDIKTSECYQSFQEAEG